MPARVDKPQSNGHETRFRGQEMKFRANQILPASSKMKIIEKKMFSRSWKMRVRGE